MFRPPTLLATLIAPTITSFNVQQLWLLLPNTPRFVTSPCPGYTSRPNRVIDGRGLSPHKTYSLVGCPHNVKLTDLQNAELSGAFCKSGSALGYMAYVLELNYNSSTKWTWNRTIFFSCTHTDIKLILFYNKITF